MAPKKTGVGGRTVRGFEPADDDDSPQPSPGRRRNRKNKKKNKKQGQGKYEQQQDEDHDRNQDRDQDQDRSQDQDQNEHKGQGQGHQHHDETRDLAFRLNPQQAPPIDTRDNDSAVQDHCAEEKSRNGKAPSGFPSKQTGDAQGPGKISRQCQEKDSQGNKKAQTEMGPQQDMIASNSIKTEPHSETNFLNPGKQAQIKKSCFAHPDKECDHHDLRPTIVPAHKDLKIVTNHFKVDLPAETVL